MYVGLIDVDGHNFPNLVLMKISSYCKGKGCKVEWANAMERFDVVYQSKVFDETYSADIDWLPQASIIRKGGTGYIRKRRKDHDTPYEIYTDGVWEKKTKHDAWKIRGGKAHYLVGNELYEEELFYDAEHCYPDYGLYPELTKDTAYGYLTRGCPNACSFCMVSDKEGYRSVKVADLDEFWRGQKYIKLLDPNLLRCPDRAELLRQLIASKAYVDFTQGLDIRAVDDTVIDLINRIKVKEIHFAWDNTEQDLTGQFRYYASLAKHKPHGRYGTVYVLTNYDSAMEENLYRVYTLRDMGYDPYIMIFDKPNAPKEVLKLQRWCNNRRIFRSVPKFEDYNRNGGR